MWRTYGTGLGYTNAFFCLMSLFDTCIWGLSHWEAQQLKMSGTETTMVSLSIQRPWKVFGVMCAVLFGCVSPPYTHSRYDGGWDRKGKRPEGGFFLYKNCGYWCEEGEKRVCDFFSKSKKERLWLSALWERCFVCPHQLQSTNAKQKTSPFTFFVSCFCKLLWKSNLKGFF